MGGIDRYVYAKKCSVMGSTDWYVYAKNAVSWEALTGVFMLIMECHGRHRPVCLRTKCSAMGVQDLYVYAKNVAS